MEEAIKNWKNQAEPSAELCTESWNKFALITTGLPEVIPTDSNLLG